MTQRYFIRPADVMPYSPANHHGTVNRRLIGPETVGATQVEVLHGTLQPGGKALPHAHPGIEQVCYILAGRARAEVGGQAQELGPGDCCFFPADQEHVFTVLGEEAVQLLVIYAPPYGEDPAKVIRRAAAE